MRRFTRAVAGSLGIAAALAASPGFGATIASVSPRGEIAQVRQFTVKFSEAVVPFGDPRLADPLALHCSGGVPSGVGRWVNDRVWVYDFASDLPPGSRCTASLRPEWKPTGGAL